MELKIESEHLNGIKIIVPEAFEDDRGFFMETYRSDQYEKFGLPPVFLQDNHSRSAKNVLRGLHFQFNPPMGKVMRVTYGAALLIAVDIRKDSPTQGRWHTCEVSALNKRQIWAPAGFARGFYVLTDFAEIQYKCTHLYNKPGESGIVWNDPEINIKLPFKKIILSEKDKNAQTLKQWLDCHDSNIFNY